METPSPDAAYLSGPPNVLAQDSTTSLARLAGATAAAQHDAKMTLEVAQMAARGRQRIAETNVGAGLTVSGGQVFKGPAVGQV